MKTAATREDSELDFPKALSQETFGTERAANPFVISRHDDPLHQARQALDAAHRDSAVRVQAFTLLADIRQILVEWSQRGLDASTLPDLWVYFPDDGSVRLEWSSATYRVGFAIEPKQEESSWYAVATEEFEAGALGASGLLPATNRDKLLAWIMGLLVASP